MSAAAMGGVLFTIKSWVLGLDLWGKFIGSIVSFFTSGILKRIWNRMKPSAEEEAFNRAVKSWNTSHYVRGYYKQHRLKTISDFCEYVEKQHDGYDNDIDSLYRRFEEELAKTTDGRLFLQNLRLKALNKVQYEGLMRINELLNGQKALYEMLTEIRQELCSHNKGKREFEEYENYIQRYCTLRLKSDEYFKYIIEHKGIDRYKLVDIVSGRTECKGNKFILYSDAQTGKTTELLRLGWELQEEGSMIPIMFKVRGCQSIKQELPALRSDVEKGLVVIIDALDEKFEGDMRFGLYNEIETYAEEHPDLKIVLTCRENFSGEHIFNGFKELNLTDLTWQDSVEYLTGCDMGNVVTEIEKRKLYEFVRSPFYLTGLANYYKAKHALPDNKGELYEFFIDRRLEQEENLGLKESAAMLSKGKKLLQKMAVAMQLMGLNEMDKEDILSLLDHQYDDYNRILRSGLIEHGENNGYCFTHNSFKEYFVACYLLTLNSIEKIQKLSCYAGTKVVRTGWSNTVALLLAQLPKDSELSKKILEWIVADNKELLLYVERNLLQEKDRTRIFKEILQWHKEKNLRFADMGTSRYEDLMEFGRSADSIDYLLSELETCEEIDCHTVNVLFLLRYVRYEDLTNKKAATMKESLLKSFEKFKDDDEHIYVLFEVARTPWLQRSETVEAVYNTLKDTKHPNIVNHLVEYITEAGCADDYEDVIIEKGEYIRCYDKDGYTRILNKENLYEAYDAFTTWENIKKALSQLKREYLQHLVASIDEERHEQITGKLLEKVALMTTEYPDAPDFVYDMLIEMAEDRSTARRMEKDVFKRYFDNTGLSQKYFDESVKVVKDYLLDTKEWSYQDQQKIEGRVYCAALLMDENRLEQVADSFKKNDENGNRLLVWLSYYAPEEMRKEISIIRKNRYPKYWLDDDGQTKWQKLAQLEYDELMDYDRFKDKVLKIIEEKAPKNKADMKALRHAKITFTSEEEERMSRYVSSIFYEFYNERDDSFDLDGVRSFIEKYERYQKIVVKFTEEFLYDNNERITICEAQKKIFREAVVAWLQELADDPYCIGFSYKHPAISVLLHHDVIVDDGLLLRLLPYSSCDIYIRGEGYSGRNYSLFDYISERCDDKPDFLKALRECMDSSVEYAEKNWKEWCVYLVKQNVSSEYQRAINKMLELPCADPSLSIAIALLENDETRPMVLKNEVIERCDDEKKLFIYEQLSSEHAMDNLVKDGVEQMFDGMEDGDKRRAVRLLLLKGSVKGLEYANENISVIEMRTDIRGYGIESLPLLLSVYSKSLDQKFRSDYAGVLRAIENIAEANDEGWTEVNRRFDELIKMDEKKFRHLNWYLRDWSVKRMEKASPVMTIEEVKAMLAA